MLSSVCATCADVPTLLVKAAGGLFHESVELSKERLSFGRLSFNAATLWPLLSERTATPWCGSRGAGRARAMSAAPSVAGLCPINNGWPFQYNKHVKLTEINRTGVKTHCKNM